MALDRNRLRYMAEVFVSECRRQRIALFPDLPNPVKSLGEYPSDQQAAIMRAMEKAHIASTPGADSFFNDWLSKQQEGQ